MCLQLILRVKICQDLTGRISFKFTVVCTKDQSVWVSEFASTAEFNRAACLCKLKLDCAAPPCLELQLMLPIMG